MIDYEARLKELAALEDNWDGEGTEVPSSESIELARRFLALLHEDGMEFFSVVPSAEGGVAVVFFNDLKKAKYSDVEFHNDGEVISVFADPGEGIGVEAFDVLPTDAGFRAEIARVKEFLNA